MDSILSTIGTGAILDGMGGGVSGLCMGRFNTSLLPTTALLGSWLGSFGTSGISSDVLDCPPLDPDREKSLGGQARPDFAFEPADLVWRSLWKTDRSERCLSSVDWPVRGTLYSLSGSFVAALCLIFGIAARLALRCLIAEVVAARRTPGGRYLSWGSRVKTRMESMDVDEPLWLSALDCIGTSRTLTT